MIISDHASKTWIIVTAMLPYRCRLCPIDITKLQLPSPLLAAGIARLVLSRLGVGVVNMAIVLVVRQVVIEDETLDALLLSALRFLLRAHSNRKAGIGGQID